MKIFALVVAVALGACVSDPPPHQGTSSDELATCGFSCFDDLQCRSDSFGSCKYCVGFHCSNTLPAAPVSIDAGVDAK